MELTLTAGCLYVGMSGRCWLWLEVASCVFFFYLQDLKQGTKISMSRADVLRKTGELFALRHLINLSSDLLDTPDFYWEHEEQEELYQKMCSYFSINRRTRVRMQCDYVWLLLCVRLVNWAAVPNVYKQDPKIQEMGSQCGLLTL